METTVVLLKPDCIEKNLTGEVIKRFEALGLRIRGCKLLSATDDLLKAHYSHLADKPFFPEIVEFMQATPILALALEGANSIVTVRDHLGPTDSAAAPKGTIRGDFGTDKMRNIAHASDSTESATAEIARFFSSDELF